MFACKLASDLTFIGRGTVKLARSTGVRRRLVSVALDGASDRMLWGGETLLHNGQPVGFLSSAVYGHSIDAPVGLAYLTNPDGVVSAEYVETGHYQVDLAGERLDARVQLRALYDPKGERVRA